jgi:hypothetical protein
MSTVEWNTIHLPLFGISCAGAEVWNACLTRGLIWTYLDVLWHLAVTKGSGRRVRGGQAVSTKHRDPEKENQKLQTTFLTFTTQEIADIFTQIWTNEV